MTETKLKPQSGSTLTSKAITATRDMTAASGDVAYTGVGFTPKAIYAISSIDGGYGWSSGFCDENLAEYCVQANTATVTYIRSTVIYIQDTVSTAQEAIVKSLDSDGFTLTWTKSGSPSGTATLRFICIR